LTPNQFPGTHNFFQDDSSDQAELIARVNTVIDHIRSKAKSWEQILSSSALISSLGSLVNTIATRLIIDVFDLSSMSVTEAETTATVISLVEKLDDLFLPKPGSGNLSGLSGPDNQFPLTAQYADHWMKMQFLSQTLQSNLNDIHYLWFESDLSLYFTAQEVIDLIELSFENNPQVRNQIRQIRENPHPKGHEL
jgi:centromere/kinetochore protein ZW10